MNPAEDRSDEQLAELAAQGDDGAASHLGQRFVPLLFDFAVRITLDEVLAESIVAAVFTRAIEQQASRPPRLSFRASILGLTRDESLDGLRRRANPDATDDAQAMLSPTDDRFMRVAEDAYDAEFGVWAWQAARSQRPRDYSLLDLVVRRQLEPQDVADVSGQSRSGIYPLVGRLRGAFEESFATSALYARRDRCPDVVALAALTSSLTPALRRDIGRHAEACEVCRATRAELPAAADVLAALLDVEPPATLVDAFVNISATPESSPDAATPSPLFDDEVASVAPAAPVGLGLLRDLIDRPPEELEALSEGVATPEPPPSEAPDTFPDTQPMSWEIEESEEPPDDAPSGNKTPLGEAGEAGDAPPVVAVQPPPDERDEPAPVEPEGATEAEKDEPEPESTALVPAAPTAIVLGAGSRPPPRRPIVIPMRPADDGGRKRTLTILIVILASAIAGYVGIAVGDSIQGGGTSVTGTVTPLPTRVPEVRQVACGTAPIAMDQGSLAAIAFDATALPSYQIAEAAVRTVSSSASLRSVKATAQQDLSVLFEAFTVGGVAGRVDEYELAVTFARGEERTVAQCRILVTALAPTATPTLIPIEVPTETPTAVPTATPLVFPTAPPPPPPTLVPTDTAVPPTATPETPTSTPTPSPTSTPTVTGTPPTSTPTATGTATNTPTPTPIATP